MNKPDLFSYLSAFVAIMLAVALGDMIQSVHRLIKARRRVKWDVIPLIFAAGQFRSKASRGDVRANPCYAPRITRPMPPSLL